MKFLYEYRTPDNALHNGEIRASDRDAAYSALKSRGIRPSRLCDAPGLMNRIFGRGKRWIAIVFLATVCVLLAVIIGRLKGDKDLVVVDELFDSAMRRQIIGDPAIIDRGIRTGWADVFDLEGDRFLASFAVPGVEAAVKSTSEDAIRECLIMDDVRGSGGIEHRQIVSIVNGMKQELREYLSAGGNIKSYGRRLVRRQEAEIGYYRGVVKEIEAAADQGASLKDIEQIVDMRNVQLRGMGIRTVIFDELIRGLNMDVDSHESGQ